MTSTAAPAPPGSPRRRLAWNAESDLGLGAHILAGLFFLAMPIAGLWAVLQVGGFVLQAGDRLAGPGFPSMVASTIVIHLSFAAPAFGAGLLASRVGHVVAYGLGAAALIGFVWMLDRAFGGTYGVWELAPIAGLVAVSFAAGHVLRWRRGDGRGATIVGVGLGLASLAFVLSPLLQSTLQSSGRMGWVDAPAAAEHGIELSLPGDFSGSHLWDPSAHAATYYGDGRSVIVMSADVEPGTESQRFAWSVDRQDAFGWGAPDATERVTVNGTAWLVRRHQTTDDTQFPVGGASIGDGVPASVVDAVTVRGGRGIVVAVRTPASDTIADAQAVLLEVLDTVEFAP